MMAGVDDRLLDYEQPSTPRPPGFSRYGTVGAAAAGVGIVLAVFASLSRFTGRLEPLEPLVFVCIVFCAGVAVFGFLLAAMDRRNWRTLMWVGIGVVSLAIAGYVGVTNGYLRF
jgi:hypothetical protein